MLKEDLIKTFKKEFLNKEFDKKTGKSGLKRKPDRDLTGLTVEQIKKIEKNRKKTLK